MPENTRYFSLDAMRGFAVMGILLMNITAFALPQATYFVPDAAGPLSLADRIAWFATFVLIDGKMRGLFSMLFGASMLVIMDRAEIAGQDGRVVHLNRVAWLFLFGLAHYLFIWWGDILMLYALVSLLALPLAGRAPLSLVKWAFLCFAVQFLIAIAYVAYGYGVQYAALHPGASAQAVQAWRDLLGDLGAPGTSGVAREQAIYSGGYGAMLSYRLTGLGNELSGMLMFSLFDTLGFMLIGMAMLKGGFMTGDWPAEQYRRTMRHCYAIGLPPMILLGAWVLWSGFAPLTSFAAQFAWSFPFRIPLTVGHAALILWLIARAGEAPFLQRVAATGRAAFSNYLGSSIVMTGIFYGYGLGLFGRVGRAESYGFVLLAWALMLLWARPWLARFHYGPFEWAWRSLARRRLQPMRR